jgi:hypothetical protein
VGDSNTGDAGGDAGNDATNDVKAPTDAGSDVVADATADVDAAPPFDVKSLPGLSLWLVASKGVTADGSNQVTKWADQSGNTNDATQGASEPTQPTLVATATNNLPAIHFEGGAHLEMADNASLQLGTGDFALTLVMRHTTQTTNGNYGLVFAKQALTSGYPGIAVFVDIPQATTFYGQVDIAHYAATTTSGLNDNTPHVFGFRRAGATVTTRLDGVDDGSSTTDAGNTDCTATGVPARIGAGGEGNSAGQQLKGDVSEVVLVKGATTAQDLSALEKYLKAKYAL